MDILRLSELSNSGKAKYEILIGKEKPNTTSVRLSVNSDTHGNQQSEGS